MYPLVKNRKKIAFAVKNMFDNDNCGKKCEIYADVTLPVPGKDIALFCSELIQEFEKSVRDGVVPEFPKGITKVQVLRYPASSKPDIGWILKDIYDRVWVVFRGTQSIEEGAQDILFGYSNTGILSPGLVEGGDYSLHKGFVNIYNSFQKKLHSTIESLNPKELIITGHSLGAALATISMFSFKDRPNTVGYGFGCPRVGNIDFVSIFNKEPNITWYNIINICDIFTNLPLSVMINILDPLEPYLYQQAGIIITFSTNWGSFLANHLLPIYQDFLLTEHKDT